MDNYNNDWDSLTHEQKNHLLFLKQKALLDQFLEKGAISQKQHDKSLHDLIEKMGETSKEMYGDIIITKAETEDLKEILELQYLAYQSEAALFGNREIPPLKQTLEEVICEYNEGIILKLCDEQNRIIGSIRARENNGTVYIGKLMVHPDHRRKGNGSKLLYEIEKYFPDRRYELFTSTRSKDNIRLYERIGYKEFAQKAVDEELHFVYMEKPGQDSVKHTYIKE